MAGGGDVVAGGRIKLAAVTVAAFAAGAGAGAAATFQAAARVVAPTAVEAPSADAVVVLAGSPGERLPRGLELMADGAAPTLVLSAGDGSPAGWGQVAHLCNDDHDFELVCVNAQSNNTIGEAATISRLAHERGWDTLALVTSSYHLDRATVYFRTCFDGTVLPVAATPKRLTWPLVRHELLGAVHARTVGQVCPAPPPGGQHHDQDNNDKNDKNNNNLELADS